MLQRRPRRFLSVLALSAGLLPLSRLGAADCNGNGVEDDAEIAAAESEDCNANAVPDECEFLSVRFGPGESFSAGTVVEELLATDVDGDGASDLIVGHQARDRTSSLRVLLNQRDRTWDVQDEVPAGERLSSLAVGDFDGDGDVDAVTANSTEILLFENDSTGSFGSPVSVPVARFTRFVVAGEATGDGLIDLVVTNTTDDTVAVLSGSGDGTFAAPKGLSVGERPEAAGVADVDGDGQPDIFSANADSRSVSLLRGLGGGAFSAPADYPVDGRARRLHWSDLDGDESIDLLVETSTSFLRLLNSGDGTFQEPVEFPLFARYSALVDLDGDGDMDALTEEGNGRSLTAYSNDGAGRFVQSLTLGLQAWLFVTGDFDLDADPDIVFSLQDSPELTSLWNGGGALAVSRETIDGTAPHFAILRDLDRDGDLDLATPDGPSDHVSIYKNPGDGRFAERQRYRAAQQGHLFALVDGDLDADGDIDLVATDRVDNVVAVLLNLGDGTFGPVDQRRTGRAPFHSDLGDFDGDGALDVATTNRADNTLSLYFNDGNAGFFDLSTYDTGTSPWGVAHGDLDGDGDHEIVTAHGLSFDVGILWNTGQREFSSMLLPVAEGPHYLGVADLEGDGDLEIVAQSSDAVMILVNDSSGGFDSRRRLSVDSGGYALTIGDVDLDGVLDLLTTHWGPNTINLLFGRGDLVFADPIQITVGALPKVAALGDIDRDGDVDIVCPNRTDDNIMILRNQGTSDSEGADFLPAVCTAREFELLATPVGSGSIERTARYLLPLREDPGLPRAIFQNVRLRPVQLEFLRQVFPERFEGLTAERYGELVEQRATREYYGGAVHRVRTDAGFVYGFDVLTDAADAQELPGPDEVRAVFEMLEGSFLLGPLVYFPTTAAGRERAALWESPGFPVLIVEDSPPGEEPGPVAGNPTFELRVPEGLEICGTFGESGVDRGLREEYELKSVLRLAGGSYLLPTMDDSSEGTLFEELVFGPGREVVSAHEPGLFRVRRVPGADSVTYRFSYSQSFRLGDGRSFDVGIDSPLQFRGRGDKALDGPFSFTEEYFTRIAGTEAIRASIDGVPLVNYGSCTYALLPRVEVSAELEDGTQMRLVERFLEAELEIETAPASLIHAEVVLGGERLVVGDYFRLVYSAFRHNVGPSYWVLFDAPVAVPGVDGSVRGLELVDEFPGRWDSSAAYLGMDLEVLRPVGVKSLSRRELPAGTPFRRGDANADGSVNVVDAIVLLDHVFRRGPALSCAEAGDANADGLLNIADATTLVGQIFGGHAVSPPFPECGRGAEESDLSCASFGACE